MSEAPITLVAAVITAVVAIWQFSSGQRQANKRPFLERQLQTVFETTNVVATLVSETDPEKWEDARKAFWRLYWGCLGIVEDPAIERVMVEIGNSVPKSPGEVVKIPMPELGQQSLRLAHVSRKLILKNWRVNIPDLSKDRSSAA